MGVLLTYTRRPFPCTDSNSFGPILTKGLSKVTKAQELGMGIYKAHVIGDKNNKLRLQGSGQATALCPFAVNLPFRSDLNCSSGELSLHRFLTLASARSRNVNNVYAPMRMPWSVNFATKASVPKSSSRSCRLARGSRTGFPKSSQKSLCPGYGLFGAGYEDLRNDTHLTGNKASVRHQVDYSGCVV